MSLEAWRKFFSTAKACPLAPESPPSLSESLVTVDAVVGSSINTIGEFKFEKTDTIMALKWRLQQDFKVLVCSQRLTMGRYVPGDDDLLGALPSRPILRLEILPFDPKIGGSLLKAARQGDSVGVQEALCARADPNVKNANDWTPLFLAAGGGHVETVRLLHRQSADVDAVAQDGTTPLLIATCEGRLDVVRLLCEIGAEKDRASLAGATPLHMAAEAGDLGLARALCESGAGIDVATPDSATPLFLAAEQGHLQLVHYLCDVGADKDKATKDEETPLLVAVQRGHKEVAQFLRRLGADPLKASLYGESPLYAAVKSRNSNILPCL